MKRFLLYTAFTAISFMTLQDKAFAVICQIESVSHIVFGNNLDLTSSGNIDSTGQIDIFCRRNVETAPTSRQVQICVDLGTGEGGAEYNQRTMLSGNTKLRYNLYRDPSRSTPWGALDKPNLGQPQSIVFDLPPNGSVFKSMNIYGRVFSGQLGASEGAYTSTFSNREVLVYYKDFEVEANPSSCELIRGNQVSTSFTVSAHVTKSCSVTAHNIDFGIHSSLRDREVASGGLDVLCSPDATYKISLNRGMNGDASGRRMKSEKGDFIPYQLTLDEGCTNPWDRKVQWTSQFQLERVPIFGCVGPEDNIQPGKYSDYVTAEIEY